METKKKVIPIIAMDHVSKQYSTGVEALSDVSICIHKGEFVFVVGKSGSGKSTFIKLLLKELNPTEGRIFVGGRQVTNLKRKQVSLYRRKIGVVFQDFRLLKNKTVFENVAFAQEIIGMTKRDIARNVPLMLEMVGLKGKEKMYPHELSGGMRQRVMIAIALACEPKLLIADEPTTALDVTIQAQILELMMELKDKLGMAIIMITHDLGIVASMCDRIAVMYAGRIVETGTCDEIFYHPKHEYTKGLLESIPRLDSTKHEKLIPIEGNPVDLLNPPEGCEFAPRCKNCMKICLRENPPRTDFSETHYAHCFMNQKAEMEGGNTNE